MNSACVVNLLEESGTLGFHPAFPTWRRLIFTHSHQSPIRIQKKEIKSFYQVKGHKELQFTAGVRSQKSTQVKYSERGKKTDVKRLMYSRCCSPFPMNTYVQEEGSCTLMLATSYSSVRRAFYKTIINPRNMFKERKSFSKSKK